MTLQGERLVLQRAQAGLLQPALSHHWLPHQVIHVTHDYMSHMITCDT